MFEKDGTPATKISWSAPTENTDGSPIDYALAYQLYVDGAATITFPGSLNPDGTYSFGLALVPAIEPRGAYELTLTAFPDGDPQRESEQSNAIIVESVRIPLAPGQFGAA